MAFYIRKDETTILQSFMLGLAVVAATALIISVVVFLLSIPSSHLLALAAVGVAFLLLIAVCVGIGWLLQKIGWEPDR